MSITINLTRPSKTFTEGEIVRGYIEIDLNKPISHNGLKLSVEAWYVPKAINCFKKTTISNEISILTNEIK